MCNFILGLKISIWVPSIAPITWGIGELLIILKSCIAFAVSSVVRGNIRHWYGFPKISYEDSCTSFMKVDLPILNTLLIDL